MQVGKCAFFQWKTSHILPFQMRLKSSNLDGLEGRYCNINCNVVCLL